MAETTPRRGDLDGILRRVLGRLAAPRVVSAYVFGSHAEGRAHRESDIDLGILLSYEAYPTARERFEARVLISSRLVAELRQRDVDVVVLNDAPPELARRVVTAGHRVFCADEHADHAFVRDVQLRAADIAPFLRRTRLGWRSCGATSITSGRSGPGSPVARCSSATYRCTTTSSSLS